MLEVLLHVLILSRIRMGVADRQVTPIRIAQSQTEGEHDAQYAMDKNMGTFSKAQQSGVDYAWLQASFDKVYCIEQVRVIYGSNGASSNYTCTDKGCSCNQDSKCFTDVSVYENESSGQQWEEKEGCKLGDTVIVSRRDTYTLSVYELEVFSDEDLAQCSILDTSWKNVIADPALPAEEGAKITLTCPELYKNKGGKYADCKSEIFELHGDPPRCVFDIGKYKTCLGEQPTG